MKYADFVSSPRIIAEHTSNRALIGQDVVQLKDNSLLMIVPTGRAPVDFEDRDISPQMPLFFRSRDKGKNWEFEKKLDIQWELKGIICGGGASLKYLRDGRLALLLHRKVQGYHGGGSPAFLTSPDEGISWSAPGLLAAKEGIFYMMNSRLQELSSGRLVVPVAVPAANNREKYYEGGACDSACFYSDDLGKSWSFSSKTAKLPEDPRGMAEPAIVETGNGKLMMLCRTGKACLYQSWSDDMGESWSTPQSTTLKSPCSSFSLSKLDNEKIIAVYNHAEPMRPAAFFPRNPLTYSISNDNGRTWQEPFIIDESGLIPEPDLLQHIYPAVCPVGSDLLLSYTTHHAPADGEFNQQKQKNIGGLKTALIRI